MRAGKLIHKISIIKAEKTVAEYNTEIENDVIIYPDLKASLKYNSFNGNADGELNKIINPQKVSFRIYYRKNIDDECKVLFNDIQYQIFGVEIIGRNRELMLHTTKL